MDNLLISEAHYSWVNYEWGGYKRYDYEYDENNRLIVKTGYTWDYVFSEWWMPVKEEYTYDDNDNLVSVVVRYWHVTAHEWYPYHKIEYVYNNENNLVMVSYYDCYTASPEEWIVYRRCRHTYYQTNIAETANFPYNFTLFPNPARKSVKVLCDKHLIGSTLEIINTRGQTVKSLTIDNNLTVIDLDKVAKGIYFVKVTTPKGAGVKKLAVE
jgi:hypothetical protein